MGKSIIQRLAELPREEADAIYEAMSPDERAALLLWAANARPEQLPPEGDWSYWGLMGGRGSGKTKGAAEWVCDRIESGVARWVGFIGRTAGDCRRIQVAGESGFIACAEARGLTVVEQPSKAQLIVEGEVTVMLFSADEPDSLRGPQTDTLWGDEFAAWAPKQDSVGNTAFTNAKGGLRLGDDPRGVFTTTPKPIPEVKEAFENKSRLWALTQMATRDNVANLAPSFIVTLREQFEGTRLWDQEFEGLYLERVEGALWTHELIALTRRDANEVPGVPLRAVAVDPSVSANGEGDECGIIAGGVGDDSHFYVWRDDSLAASPEGWAQRAVDTYHLIRAQAMVVEVNNGGAAVTAMVKNIDANVNIVPVRAADSKRARAEPVAQLWEQGRAHMVGVLGGLEGQITTWSGKSKKSPDRLDALVWLGHWAKELMRAAPVELVIPHAEPPRLPVTTTASGLSVVSGRDVAGLMMRRHQSADDDVPW